jgi:hypothetical protein
VVDEPESAWMIELERQVEAQGVGTMVCRLFLANNHRRRNFAKAAFVMAMCLAVGAWLRNPVPSAFLFGPLWWLVFAPLPHETLVKEPSRPYDLALAGASLVPVVIAALTFLEPPDRSWQRAALAAIVLAIAAAVALVLETFLATRKMWFTCTLGLVATNGRGRVQAAVSYDDVVDLRVDSVIRPLAVKRNPSHCWNDEWFLTTAAGAKYRIPLHRGGVLAALPPHFAIGDRPPPDPLSTWLVDHPVRRLVGDLRERLAGGEAVELGRGMVLRQDGVHAQRRRIAPPWIVWRSVILYRSHPFHPFRRRSHLVVSSAGQDRTIVATRRLPAEVLFSDQVRNLRFAEWA